MKKIFFLIMAITVLLPLSGCEKETMSYEGPNGIYFYARWGDNFAESRWPFWSYSAFDFVRVVPSTYTATLRVMTTSKIYDVDREFRYQINAEITNGRAGIDYDIPEGKGVIPAGSVEGVATVVLHRTPEMESGVVTVGLELLANENFELIFTDFIQPDELNGSSEAIEQIVDLSKHQLRIRDVLVQPTQWLGGFYQYGNDEEFNAFGAFSPKKIRLLFELFDLTYTDFLDANIMPISRMNVLGKRLSYYLIEQYANHTPILENDGRLMWASECRWLSYENVPWDGTYNPEYYNPK